MTESLRINATAEARVAYSLEKAMKINRGIAVTTSILLIAATAALVSCRSKLQHPPPVIDTPIVCQVFEPIEAIESDSKRTKEQIDVYNATWDYYCRN